MVGQLNYLARFVPDILSIIAPIRALLKSKGTLLWTAACTNALCKAMELLSKRLHLGVVQPGAPVDLFVCVSGTAAIVVGC